ncbi:NAD(P)-dependent oxidoreductase [Candidatus Woesebacteria bacterium]|nr:NAD(P)-dependent oxidoreductase [Candidatus Woesebacteria bacterium]
MAKPKILITGSTGLIGTRITEMLSEKYDFIPLLQSEIDITNKMAVNARLASTEFDFLLHLAAYTNVDGAESNKELCTSINVEGTRNLFEVCQDKGKKMIHISTDFVFDGRAKIDSGVGAEAPRETPCYTENSLPNPISHYGLTKYQAEQVVQDNAMIVRLSYPYRKEFAGKRDFVRTIRYLLEQGKTIQMVTDSLITPTFIDDIVMGLGYLIEHYSPNIFHLVGADSMSPFEAGQLIARIFELDEKLIQPTTYAEYFKGKALRPQWARIVNTKEEIVMSTFSDGLKATSKKLI